MKTVKLSLYQNDVKFSFQIETELELTQETTDKIVEILGKKLLTIYDTQKRIVENGGKSRFFHISKGKGWYVDIDVIEQGERATLISGVEFKVSQLGTDKPIEVLKDIVRGFNLQNEVLLLE